jgi:hypothetical protein
LASRRQTANRARKGPVFFSCGNCSILAAARKSDGTFREARSP